MVRALVSTIFTFALLGCGGGRVNPYPCPTAPFSQDEFRKAQEEFKSKFQVDVQIATDAEVEYNTLPDSGYPALKHHLHLLDRELSRYWHGTLAKAHVAQIFLLNGLSDNGKVYSGLAQYGDSRIFLNFSFEKCDDDWFVGTVHHELFHMFDAITPYLVSRSEWTAANPAGFSYGIAPLGLRPAHWEQPVRPGFVTDYARTMAGEDRAETYFVLMMPRTAKYIDEWTSTDGALREKFRLIKQGMQRLDPRYDDSFWARIRAE